MALIASLPVIAGCAANRESPGLNQPFAVLEHEKIELRSVGLTVAFDAVVADSRCPSDTRCVWEGNAELRLVVSDENDRYATVNVNTVGGVQHPRSRCALDHRVELLGLEPQRRSSGSVMLNDYEVTLRLTRGCDQPVE